MARIKAFGFDKVNAAFRETRQQYGAANEWGVEVNDRKASLLEFGTSRMAPRPFFRPAIQFVRDRFPFYVSRLRPGRSSLDAILKQMAIDAADKMRASMNEAKTGIKYPHLPRRSSAPSEAPAIQSGQLEGSIRVVSKGGKRARKSPVS